MRSNSYRGMSMRGLLISSRGQTPLLARPATYLVEHLPYHAKQILSPTRYHSPPSHATPYITHTIHMRLSINQTMSHPEVQHRPLPTPSEQCTPYHKAKPPQACTALLIEPLRNVKIHLICVVLGLSRCPVGIRI